MANYLETVLKEWWVNDKFDEDPKMPKTAEEIKAFADAHMTRILAYIKGWSAPIEPEPTEENIRKELEYLLGEEEMPVRPPLCPHCTQPLMTFYEDRGAPEYEYDSETGKYERQDAQEQVEIKCGKCDSPIGGWRADGEHWGLIPGAGLPETDE